jgi:hypothetical protein
MIRCICASVALLLLAGVAASQSLPNNISCPEGTSGDSCRSFKDAIDDQDKHIVEAVKRRDHVIVCFRPTEDVFLLLAYDSPRRGSWHESTGQRGFQQMGTVDFIKFRNGNANLGGESLFADGLWVSPSIDDDSRSQFSGTLLMPGEHGEVRIDSSGVQISHSFRDKWEKDKLNDPLTRYEFSMKSSSDAFVETFAPSASSNAPAHETTISGKCLTYK